MTHVVWSRLMPGEMHASVDRDAGYTATADLIAGVSFQRG
jgi:hypothetical protein